MSSSEGPSLTFRFYVRVALFFDRDIAGFGRYLYNAGRILNGKINDENADCCTSFEMHGYFSSD